MMPAIHVNPSRFTPGDAYDVNHTSPGGPMSQPAGSESTGRPEEVPRGASDPPAASVPDPDPVLRFARELGRLLGQYLTQVGTAPERPEGPFQTKAGDRHRS